MTVETPSPSNGASPTPDTYVLRPHHQKHVAGISQRKQSHSDHEPYRTNSARSVGDVAGTVATFFVGSAPCLAGSCETCGSFFVSRTPNRRHQHTQRARHRSRPKHPADSVMRNQYQSAPEAPRSRPPSPSTESGRRPTQGASFGTDSGDHHVARRPTHSFGQPVSEADQQNVPPRRHQGEQGLTALATKYPATTSGLRRSMRSVRYPEKSLANEATLSASPSISPVAPALLPAKPETRAAPSTPSRWPCRSENEVAPKA